MTMEKFITADVIRKASKTLVSGEKIKRIARFESSEHKIDLYCSVNKLYELYVDDKFVADSISPARIAGLYNYHANRFWNKNNGK